MTTKRTIIDVDPATNEPSIRELGTDEKHLYNFGEAVGLLVFQPWYECIPTMGHMLYAPTYDFPVRIKFVDTPFDEAGFHTGRADWYGWNLPAWQKAARELEEQGVRAIIAGCGLTGSMQSLLVECVDIPVFTTTVQFVPLLHKSQQKNKRIGIITVNERHLRAHDEKLFRECGIDETIPITVAGLDESDWADDWQSMARADFTFDRVQMSVVNTAKKLVKDHPDIGQVVLECTDMPPYADAVRQAIHLPVFDAVDMVHWVYRMVRPAG